MSYCINPKCSHRQNSDDVEFCQTCGTPLLVQNRYRIVKPLRNPNPNHPTEVFEVEDWENWGIVKVLKVLKYVNNPDLVKRFKKEAHILFLLNDYKKHYQNRGKYLGIPSINTEGYFPIPIQQDNQKLYGLVMEKIEGQNLEDWIYEQGAIARHEALAWLKQIVEVLDFLHRHNFLHRDIKPSNLILQPNGNIALIDFGIVGMESLAETQIGSLGYAAPEQFTGKAVPQSDFFALGRTFVYLLTAKNPLDFATHKQTGRLLWRREVKGKIDRTFANFIDDLMDTNPNRRPRDTGKVMQQLQQLHKVNSSKSSTLKFGIKWFGLLMGLAVFIKALPTLNEFVLKRTDTKLTSLAEENYQEKKLERARWYSRLSLILNPENALSYRILGLICEEKFNFQCARERYREIIQSVGDRMNNDDPNDDNIILLIQGLNNLSRLQLLLETDSSGAKANLKTGFELIPVAKQHPIYGPGWQEKLIPEVRADLAKNWGWLALKEGNYEEAQQSLEAAIVLQNQFPQPQPDPYCWLAKVYQETNESEIKIEKVWTKCHKYHNLLEKPEIKALQNEARRYFKHQGGINEI
ncbi:MAG: protein kinase [Cyanobacteriota bacterium]|nr:protein kinase [Cyanobacteriota bacterium]